MTFPSSALKDWFKQTARDLPWRKTSDPYAIWVSEVMLQQTQVKTVLGYYERWMQRFPTLQTLAKAPTEEVLKYWEGLGYYSRARNLQQGAKDILEKHAGVFPSTSEELLKIKGIGPYTMGALLSFAFHKKSTLIDGNVKRVLARFFTLGQDFSVTKHHQQLEQLCEKILPDQEPWVFNEALMELGALICTPKNPQCEQCPLSRECLSKKENKAHLFPIKPQRKKPVRLYRLVWIYEFNETWAVSKQGEGIMQDLYEFPYEELKTKELMSLDIYEKLKHKNLPWHQKVEALPSVIHGFTHHHVTLYPHYVQLERSFEHPAVQWLTKEQIQEKPFSSGHKKVLKHLFQPKENNPSNSLFKIDN